MRGARMIAYWLASHLCPLALLPAHAPRAWVDGLLAGFHMGEARCQLDS
jgi:hypothetical protein